MPARRRRPSKKHSKVCCHAWKWRRAVSVITPSRSKATASNRDGTRPALRDIALDPLLELREHNATFDLPFLHLREDIVDVVQPTLGDCDEDFAGTRLGNGYLLDAQRLVELVNDGRLHWSRHDRSPVSERTRHISRSDQLADTRARLWKKRPRRD